MARWQYQQRTHPLVDSQSTATRIVPPRYPDWIRRPARIIDSGYTTPFTAALAAPVPNRDWYGQLPDLLRSPRRPPVEGLVVVPQHSPAEGSALDWIARYPDWIARLSVRAADQPFFASGATSSTFPVADFAWRPVAPDLLWSTHLSVAAIPAHTWEPNSRPDTPRLFQQLPDPVRLPRRPLLADWLAQTPRHDDAEGSSLDWTARYPDWIASLRVRAADQPFFTTGATASAFPVADFAWRPIAPDRIWRTTLPTAAHPFFAWEPNSRPPAPQLQAFLSYPDRIDRVVLRIATQAGNNFYPFPFAPAPQLQVFTEYPAWIARRVLTTALQSTLSRDVTPIPNVGAGDERIILGQKDTFGVNSEPTVGGWAW